MNLKAIVAAVALFLAAGVSTANAQSFGDLLKGAAQKAKDYNDNKKAGEETNSSASSSLGGAIGSIIKGLTQKAELDSADLAGTWKYLKPAVAFRSENFLQKAGGAAASGLIENKLAPIYQRVRLQNMEVEFTLDHKFTFRLGRAKLSGTYERDPEGQSGDFLLRFKAFGRKEYGQTEAYITISADKMSMTFDIQKLVNLVSTIANATGRASLQSMAKLLQSYDGVECGFELQKTAEAEAEAEAEPEAASSAAQ